MELSRWIERASGRRGYLVIEGTTISDSTVVALAATRRGAKRKCKGMYVDIMDVPDPLFDEAMAAMEAYKNSPEGIAEEAARLRHQEMIDNVEVTRISPTGWHIKGYRDEE